MSPLWVLPLCVLAAGSVVLAAVARRLHLAVLTVRPELDHLDRLAGEAAGVHEALDATRRRAAELAEVPSRFGAARAGAREQRLRGNGQ